MNKTIHYVWLGGNKKSCKIKKCLSSWKKFFPDWEIKEWNETNINISINNYCIEAYKAKKYAFCADVLRYDILYKHGGLYLDVDVEIIKSFEDLTENYSLFSGFELSDIGENEVAPGLVLYSKYKGNSFLKKLRDDYNNRKFILEDGSFNQKTICQYITEELEKNGLKKIDVLQTVNGFTVFPSTYFCPLNPYCERKNYTNLTRTRHLYIASWASNLSRIKLLLFKYIGINKIKKLKKSLRK